MANDPVAAYLAGVRPRYLPDRNGAAAFQQSDDATRDVPPLLDLVANLAAKHAPCQLYGREDDCPHLEPEDDTADEWHDRDDEHPSGEDLSGADDFRVCL